LQKRQVRGNPACRFFYAVCKVACGGSEAAAIERPAMPDRKGFLHPCGSATPSVAWTLCSSGMAGLSPRDAVSLQAGECAGGRMRILVGVAVRLL